MRFVLSTAFGALLGLSVVAWLLEPAPPSGGRIPLVWVSDNNPARGSQIETFNRLHPDLRLRLDPNSSGLQKIIVQASSGVGPDLCDSYNGAELQTLVEAGVAWDVTDAARAMGFAMTNAAWPGVAGEISYDGRQYSYPCNVNVDILIYNRNIFDALSVPYPQSGMTWEDLFALAQRVTRIGRGGDETVFGIANLDYTAFFYSRRGEYFSPDGTRLLIRDEPLQRAFQLHHAALFTHRIAPTSLEMKSLAGQGGWGFGALNLFADGRFAMVLSGKWALISFRRAHDHQLAARARWEADPDREPSRAPAVLRLGSVMIPRFAGQPPAYRVRSRSAVVNAASPRRDQAVRFLQYLAGPDYSRLINQGVDALPGNPRYARLGLEDGVPDLAEREMHEQTVQAMEHGYAPRFSPFLLTSDVERVLKDQVGRMESNAELPVADLLATAETELIRLMQRNLNRDPALRRRYRELTGTDDVAGAHRQQ